MIQRIQSILLLLGAGLVGSTVVLPFAKSSGQIASSPYFNDAVYQATDNTLLLLLFVVSALLALIAIFLFQKRAVQMRIALFSAIAGIIGCALTLLFYWQDSTMLTSEATIQDGAGAYLPVIGIIALLFAYRFIAKDEKLVRSMDRLR